MRLELIRHGQTDYNRDERLQGSSNIPLNETGRAQALEAASILANENLTAIVSSPLLRARETARIIADALGIQLGDTYADLIERDYASCEGMKVVSDRIPDEPNAQYPDIETRESVIARGLKAIDEIRDARLAVDGPDAAIAVVCHGTIIRFTLAAILGRHIAHIDNAAINTVEWADNAWHVRAVNGAPI